MGINDNDRWLNRLLYVIIGLVVLFAFIIAVIGVAQATFGIIQEPEWISALDAEPAAKIFNLLITTTVIAIAAYVGYRKFILFREDKPQLTLTLTVSSRLINDQHIHIGAISKIENTGKVKVDVDNIEWDLAVIAPYENSVLEEMIDEYRSVMEEDEGEYKEEKEFPWRPLEEGLYIEEELHKIERWGMRVEPGETEEVTFDFIVPVGVESVGVSVFIENQESIRDGRKPGWYRRAFHDIDGNN